MMQMDEVFVRGEKMSNIEGRARIISCLNWIDFGINRGVIGALSVSIRSIAVCSARRLLHFSF